MKPWMYLALSVILNIGYCVLSYTNLKNITIAPWVGTAIGATLGFAWMKLIGLMPNHTMAYTYGILWDTLAAITFYFVPLFISQVELNVRNVAATIFILGGTLLLKF